MTFSPALPMEYAHERVTGRPSCPKCGALCVAPEASAFVDQVAIRNEWSCDECDYEFQTSIKLTSVA